MDQHKSVIVPKYQNICMATSNVVLKYPKMSGVGAVSVKEKTKIIIKNALKYISGVKKDRFNWSNAHMIIGLQNAYEYNKDPSVIDMIEKYYDHWHHFGSKINVIDNVMNGYSLLYLYDIKNKSSYLKMINKMISYIDNSPKDKLNSLPYRMRCPDIYIDSLGMICPFLCKYSSIFNKPQYSELAIDQILSFHEYGFDKKSGLPYHGYYFGKSEKYGIIGWVCAIGWIMISFSDSREYISIDNIRQDQLVELFTNLSNTMIQYQKGNGAFSWQITVVGRPDDISVTCMITYSILKGIKLNVLPQLFMSNVNRATYYLLSGTSDDGFVNNCSAEREGFSRYPQRYGWYPWGQGYTLALLSNILITEDVSA